MEASIPCPVCVGCGRYADRPVSLNSNALLKFLLPLRVRGKRVALRRLFACT